MMVLLFEAMLGELCTAIKLNSKGAGCDVLYLSG